MKTKIYTFIIAFAALTFANKVNAQAVAEGTAITTTTEMEINASIPTLSNFIADVKDNAVKISWIVKNEPINSVYYVEKSFDEVNYVVIGTLEAQIRDSKVNEYSFIDPEPSDKTVYYSVRQESRKGSLYSKLLSVEKVKAE
jgi:predicted peroxiredoxin